MAPRAAILTDLDNTIYNWVDYFVPCFWAMVDVIRRETGIPESQIVTQFKTVYAEYGSVEYRFAIHKLPLCATMSNGALAQLVSNAWSAFIQARRAHLRTYPGVVETLRWAQRHSIAVVGISNSPMRLACGRIRQLGLSEFFTGIAAWNGGGHTWPANSSAGAAHNWNGSAKQRRAWFFSDEERKPNPAVYAAILAEIGVDPSNAWVVGDSLHRDVNPGLEIGAHGMWAKYGRICDERNLSTLLEITHWSGKQIEAIYEENPAKEVITLENSFAELRQHIPAEQIAYTPPSLEGVHEG